MRYNSYMQRIPRFAVLLVTLLVPGLAPAADNSHAPTVGRRLLQAVQKDDDAAYQQARNEALRLPPDDFVALLRLLDSAGTWHAMAMHDGLKLRREQPALAADFDDRLREIIANPRRSRAGSTIYITFPGGSERVRGLLPTPEHDTLRFEAMLTRKVELDHRYDALRPDLLALTQRDKHTVRRYVALLEELPDWVWVQGIANRLVRVVSQLPTMIDPEVPRLLAVYRRLREDRDSLLTGSAMVLIGVIGTAGPDVSAPALKEIHRFELETMAKQGLQPWAVRSADALWKEVSDMDASVTSSRHHLRGMQQRKADQDAIEHLEAEVASTEEKLERARIVFASRRLWERLQQALAKVDAGSDDNGS